MAQDPTGNSDPISDFLAQFNLDQEPSFDKALGQSLDELKAAHTRASALTEGVPAIGLDDGQRKGLAGKRSPGMDEIALSFARGLDQAPAVAQGAGVTADHLRQAVTRDGSIERVLTAGTLLMNGGENGMLLAAGALAGLCDRALSAAQALVRDPAAPATDRGDTTMAFTVAFRARDAFAAREAQAKQALTRAGHAGHQQIDQATEQAAQDRVIQAALPTIRK